MVPTYTWLELLHILVNQAPVGTLVGNQLTGNAHKIEEDLANAVDEWNFHIHHTHLVWEAIQ